MSASDSTICDSAIGGCQKSLNFKRHFDQIVLFLATF